MQQQRNADIGIIQSLIDRISKMPEENKGLNDRVIIFLWEFIKKNIKYKQKHHDKWLDVEKEYIKIMSGKLSRKMLKEKFRHRSERALIEQLRRMNLLDRYK